MFPSYSFSQVLKRIKFILFIQISVITLVTTGCSSTNAVDEANNQTNEQVVEYSDPRDPLEAINRPLWTFTWDYVDKYIARPGSLLYAEIMPTFVREGLYNMAQHLNEPSTIINQLLLFEFGKAAKTTGRFVLNSTIGLAGFYDPASDFGWNRNEKEFGEVLGRYGVPDGPYFIIPGIKPTSVREEVGDYVDKYYWPYAALGFWPSAFRWAIDGIETRIQLVEQEDMLYQSVDPYEFVKNAYFQNMRYKVFDGNPPVEVNEEEEAELDAYLDELDEID